MDLGMLEGREGVSVGKEGCRQSERATGGLGGIRDGGRMRTR